MLEYIKLVVLPFNGIKRDCRIQAYRKSIPQCQSHSDLLLSVKCEGEPVSPGQKTSVTYRWNTMKQDRDVHMQVPDHSGLICGEKRKTTKLKWVWCKSSCRTRSTALQQCSGPFVDDPEAGSKGIAVVSPGFYRSERTREAPQGRNYFSLHSSAVHLIYQVWYGNESSCRFCSHRFWNRLRHHEGAGYRFLTAIFLSLKKQRFKNGEHRWDVRD